VFLAGNWIINHMSPFPILPLRWIAKNNPPANQQYDCAGGAAPTFRGLVHVEAAT
jgi:hypothetical protein